jgi:23S rRNA A1618 N6-methylase RlmF
MKTSRNFLENINFLELSLSYPELGNHLKRSRKRLDLKGEMREWATLRDWKNPRALRDLTCAICWKYFSLRLEIPLNSLIPPVPSRLDYLLFLEDLLFGQITSADGKKDENDPQFDLDRKRAIKGIDIGTGASCIYPLLGCCLENHENWSFLGLEKDIVNLEFAMSNVERNHLKDRITFHHNTNKQDRILPKSIIKKSGPFDFVMTNPPFYENGEQLLEQREEKERGPHSLCTGKPSEMIVKGGEVGFIKQLIQESIKLRKYITWFTSLIGKKADTDILIDFLHEIKEQNSKTKPLDLIYNLETIKQGFTSRWILSWKWSS